MYNNPYINSPLIFQGNNVYRSRRFYLWIWVTRKYFKRYRFKSNGILFCRNWRALGQYVNRI